MNSFKLYHLKAFFFILFCCIVCLGFGQKPVEYNRETSYGIHFSSMGGTIGGIDFKKAWLIDDLNENRTASVQVSLAELKHAKESDVAFGDLDSFKPGKSNGLYVLRSSIAIEHTLFKKYHEDGIKLNLILGGGLNIGFLKPYYVEYVVEIDPNTNILITDFAQYDPNVHNLDLNGSTAGTVISSGGFFKGFDGIKVRPGLNAKIAMSFEFGEYKSSLQGIEIGFLTDIFTERMVTFPEAKNKFLFTSGYVGIFYGRRKYKKPKDFREYR